MIKLCKVCGQWREHYRRVGSRCKECHKAAVRARYHERMRDRAYRESERQRNRERFQTRGQWWGQKDPQRRAANVAVGNAVRDGRLIPAERCEHCGHDFSEFRREAHHEDYSRPLDVTWLCAGCHGARHRSAA